MTVLMFVAALALTAAAVYAQHQLPRYTAGRHNVLLARLVLIAVGLAFGYVSAESLRGEPVLWLLAFLIGFGLVHLPAAFILFVKQERGSGRS